MGGRANRRPTEAGRRRSAAARGVALAVLVVIAVAAVAFAGMFLLATSGTTEGPTAAVEPVRTEGRFSHAGWDSIVGRVVHRDRVDYATLKRDRRALDRYLARLAGARPEQLPTTADSLAFFINAYNAVTVALVVDRYPEIESVLDVKKVMGVPTLGFFHQEVTVLGAERSLDEIEHRILRERFREPRIHFAINCASLSCPPLRARAFTAAGLERELDEMTRRFLNDPTRNRFNRSSKTLRLSKIFEWFPEDFVAAAGSVPAFVAPYLEDARAREAVAAGAVKIEHLRYDWALNDWGPTAGDGG